MIVGNFNMTSMIGQFNSMSTVGTFILFLIKLSLNLLKQADENYLVNCSIDGAFG